MSEPALGIPAARVPSYPPYAASPGSYTGAPPRVYYAQQPPPQQQPVVYQASLMGRLNNMLDNANNDLNNFIMGRTYPTGTATTGHYAPAGTTGYYVPAPPAAAGGYYAAAPPAGPAGGYYYPPQGAASYPPVGAAAPPAHPYYAPPAAASGASWSEQQQQQAGSVAPQPPLPVSTQAMQGPSGVLRPPSLSSGASGSAAPGMQMYAAPQQQQPSSYDMAPGYPTKGK